MFKKVTRNHPGPDKEEGFDVSVKDLTDVYLIYSENEYKKSREYGFSYWEDALKERLYRVSNGQHLLTRFSCTAVN